MVIVSKAWEEDAGDDDEDNKGMNGWVIARMHDVSLQW